MTEIVLFKGVEQAVNSTPNTFTSSNSSGFDRMALRVVNFNSNLAQVNVNSTINPNSSFSLLSNTTIFIEKYNTDTVTANGGASGIVACPIGFTN